VAPEAWAQLKAEIPYLQQAARCWCQADAVADDLVQDTLIRAMPSAHLWEPGLNLRAWLLTIMRNQAFASLATNPRAKLTVAAD